MTAEVLEKELRARGLVLLGVAEHPDEAGVLVVFLHGNAGQWAHGDALAMVAEVPGVVTVAESDLTPTILVVLVEQEG